MTEQAGKTIDLCDAMDLGIRALELGRDDSERAVALLLHAAAGIVVVHKGGVTASTSIAASASIGPAFADALATMGGFIARGEAAGRA